jgi:AcrR family transcriptional regulator
VARAAGQDRAAPLSLKQEQRLVTRRRLIDAAAELFNAGGMDAATVARITQRAGTNRATFYLHFRDLEHLAVQLWKERTPANAKARIADLLDRPSVQMKDIRAWFDAVAQAYREDKEGIMRAVAAADGNSQYFRTLAEGTESIVDEGFAHFLAQFKGAERAEVAAELRLLMILLMRYMSYRHLHDYAFSNDRMERTLVKMWWRVLSRKPDA